MSALVLFLASAIRSTVPYGLLLNLLLAGA